MEAQGRLARVLEVPVSDEPYVEFDEPAALVRVGLGHRISG